MPTVFDLCNYVDETGRGRYDADLESKHIEYIKKHYQNECDQLSTCQELEIRGAGIRNVLQFLMSISSLPLLRQFCCVKNYSGSRDCNMLTRLVLETRETLETFKVQINATIGKGELQKCLVPLFRALLKSKVLTKCFIHINLDALETEGVRPSATFLKWGNLLCKPLFDRRARVIIRQFILPDLCEIVLSYLTEFFRGNLYNESSDFLVVAGNDVFIKQVL